jgi:hypothetical protein
MSTTLSLFDAQGILTDLVQAQKNTAVCAQCGDQLEGDTFILCRGPDCAPPTSDGPRLHQAHTGCKNCADNFAYIGQAGACLPCLTYLGNRRSMIKFAGVALRPPVKNTMATMMIHELNDAEQSIEEARDHQVDARIHEGAARRAAHVDDVRRRRVEAEEEARTAREEVKREAEEVKREAEELRRLAKEESDRLCLEAKAAMEKAEDEAKAAKAKAAQEVADARKKAEEDANATREAAEKEARAARKKAEEEAEDEVKATKAKAAQEVADAKERAAEEAKDAKAKAIQEVADAKKKAEEEAKVAKKKAEEEAEAVKKKAEKQAKVAKKKAEEEATAAKKRAAGEAAELRRVAQEESDQLRAAAAATLHSISPVKNKRRYKKMTKEVAAAYRRKRGETALLKKQKLANYDALLTNYAMALQKIDELTKLAKIHIKKHPDSNEEAIDEFENEVHTCFARIEGGEGGEDEQDVDGGDWHEEHGEDEQDVDGGDWHEEHGDEEDGDEENGDEEDGEGEGTPSPQRVRGPWPRVRRLRGPATRARYCSYE